MSKGASDPAAMTALVLAGRRPDRANPLHMFGPSHKALIEIEGASLLERVLTTLQRSSEISEILIAAPEDLENEFAALSRAAGIRIRCTIVPAAGSPAATILAALERVNAPGGLFVTTCDHPLLSTDMIAEFMSGVAASDAAAGAACVAKNVYEKAFPNTQRTFVRLKDFSFSGANMFWFRGVEATPLVQFWRRLETKRKKPLQMAREIGPITAMKYIAGVLTREALLQRLSNRTGVKAELIALSRAEAAIDVDKPDDVRLVHAIIQSRS